VAKTRFTKLELQILEALWATGRASIREIQETFPEPRPAYTTIQTVMYRLEGKKALRRVRKISNAHIFEPIVARDVTRHGLLDEILSFFGGKAQPMMAQLAEAGKLTRDDVRELERIINARDENRRPDRDENRRPDLQVGRSSDRRPDLQVGRSSVKGRAK
jgi:predicted transcriptional regulator